MAIVDKGYPYGRHAGDETGVDGSPYPFGECTDFLWRTFRDQGVQIAPHLGDAWEWVRSAQAQGYVIYQRPQPNMIACWGRESYPIGHVAYVEAVDSGGGYTVLEFNFGYSVRTDPGHCDERHVGLGDKQAAGFILPTGAGIGAGATTLADVTAGFNPLQVIQDEFAGIAKSIDQAALQAEANLMTLRNRVTSGAQIGLGAGIAAGGGLVIGLAASGRSPAQAARRGAGRLRRVGARRALPAVREQFPASTPQVPEPPPAPAPKVPAARATRSLKAPLQVRR